MKKLALLLFTLILLVSFSSAYELNIDSISDSAIILSFSNLDSLDVKFIDVTATAESSSVSDTYVVDTSLSSTVDSILLSVDISPLKEDYSQLDSILISGIIESNGVQEQFSKRISLRPQSNLNKTLAPELTSSELLYWTTGLAVLFVIMVVLFLFLREPKVEVVQKKVRKKSKKKKAKKKRL